MMRRSPLTLLGLSACSIAIAFIAGCGGGGGGGSSPSPTATPRPTATPQVGNCDNSTYQPNYASASGELRRWAGFPLRVYLEPTDARTRALTIRGFNRWVTATDNKVRYQIVDSASNADITVSFDLITSGDRLGLTTVYFFDGNPVLQRATIEFFYYPFDARADAEQLNETVAIHEFGHALGIGGHSPNSGDVMFPTVSGGLKQLTTRDINTLLTAYCNNFPNRSGDAVRKPQGVLRKHVISMHQDH